jgi:hypothetical protein
MPCTARPTSSTPSVGLNGNSNPMTLDTTPDVSITVMRPYRSESTLAGMMHSASNPVVSDTESAAVAGVMR